MYLLKIERDLHDTIYDAMGVVSRTGSVTAGQAFQRLAMRSPILFRRRFHFVRTRTVIVFFDSGRSRVTQQCTRHCPNC